MKRALRSRLAVAAACGVVLAAVLPGGAAETQVGPPGNNGTIKVDGTPFDSHPDNQPHVGCVFQIDFYNFDGDAEGQPPLMADVTFEGIPPTGGGVLLQDDVPIGEDPPGGGDDLDASVTYDLSDALSGIVPHPEQGHHVRLTIQADGAQGGSGPKHKVFWVEGCAGPPGTTTPPTTSPPTPSSTPPTTAGPGSPPGRGQPGQGGVTSPGAAGQGVGQAPPARAVPGRPDFTG
jgi:hypothetical protein